MTNIAKTFTHSFILIALLAACGGKSTVQAPAPASNASLSQQNVDATVWFRTAAERDYIFLQTYKMAEERVDRALATVSGDREPAVVLDIDETVLDNSPYNVQCIKNGKTYSEESWNEWVNAATAKLMPGAKSFIQFCYERGVQIYYISNRSEKTLEKTIDNLNLRRLPFADPEHVLLKGETSDKTQRRERIVNTYDVLLFVGDNLRDFDERFKNRSKNYGKDVVNQYFEEFYERFILLPNPMYGEWQKAFNSSENASEIEKAESKLNQLPFADQ